MLIVVQQQKGATQVKLTGAIRLVQKYLFYFSDISAISFFSDSISK
jgi:hypothetical protein